MVLLTGRMTSMPSVSHSEVDSYLLCRRKHYYGYGLGLERVSTSHSLATGTAGHRILEAFYGHLLDLAATPQAQLERFDLGMEKAKKNMTQLFKKVTKTRQTAHLSTKFSLTKIGDTLLTNSWFAKVGPFLL